VTRPKVLVAAPHYWTSPYQVAGQHLARAFAAEGWDVAYVSNPISPLHLGKGLSRDLRDRFALYRRGAIEAGDGVRAWVPGALATPSLGPLLGSRWLLRNWPRLSLPNVAQRLRSWGFGSVDLLYIDTVVQSFWLDAIGHQRSVLRVGDRMSAFDRFSPAMSAELEGLIPRVDVVAHSAASLSDDIRRFGPKRLVHLPNGVDVAAFASGSPARPPEYDGLAGPIAVYVGAIDEWFDFGLMDHLTQAMPDVAFVLIGPAELARRRLTARENLHVLGPRPYASLPSYLRHANVGLVPFDVAGHAELVNAIHPLKLYEYLASGLAVVATRWDELERLGSPAVLARTTSEFESAVRTGLAQPFDREAARRFVRGADWRARARALIDG
jgi:glycosyltransferase involved in cell wall biosynthesis